MHDTDALPPSPIRQVLAWAVHFYTALGLVAAAGIAVCIVRGDADSFRLAFVLMFVATVIDATDGTLARAIRIKEVLPSFDGRRLDDLVDFLTYSFLPLLLLWRARLLPDDQAGWLLVPLLASAYGFCQVSVKTPDGYFLGFPSYWNLIAFYLYMLWPPAWLTLALLLLFAFLTFVPLRYLYPSLGGKLGLLTTGLGVVWGGLLAWIMWDLQGEAVSGLTLASLAFPVYYLGASWVISWRWWRVQRALAQPEGAFREGRPFENHAG